MPIAPATTWPSCSSATRGPQNAPPREKPRVPSRGSTIQRVALPRSSTPLSSARTLCVGKDVADDGEDRRLGLFVRRGDG
jgi:hypothetical protein